MERIYGIGRLERKAFGWHYVLVQAVPMRWERLHKQAHLLHWRIRHRRWTLPVPD